MAVTRKMRSRIDNLLTVYLNHLERHEGGWHGENDLHRLKVWKGDLPPASGMDTSNDFMIQAAGASRKRHAELTIIQWLLGMPEPCKDCGKGDEPVCSACSGLGVTIQKGQIKPEYSLVLLAQRYWQKDPAHVVCGRLGLKSEKQMEGRLSRAREALAIELCKYDELKQLILLASSASARIAEVATV